MANLVMYCGIIVQVREALGATFVCTTIYSVEATGYTNDTPKPYAPLKRTYAMNCTFIVYMWLLTLETSFTF